MIYFVNVFFEQRDGAIGHTSSNTTSIDDAKMEYHAQLASLFAPANRENNAWATVQVIDQNGMTIAIEHADFDQFTSSTP